MGVSWRQFLGSVLSKAAELAAKGGEVVAPPPDSDPEGPKPATLHEDTSPNQRPEGWESPQ